MKAKKRTFYRNLLAMAIRNDRWWSNPKHYDKIVSYLQYRNRIAFICLLILFCSCSGTKKLEKTNLSSNLKTDTEVSKKLDEKQTGSVTDQSVKTSDKKTDLSEKKQKVTETKITDYDPSKPIVPGTNKPPVLKETVKTETEINKKDLQIQETLTDKLNLQKSYTRELQTKLDSIMKVNASLISKNESKEVPVMSWWKFIIIGIVIGLIGMFFIMKIPFVIIFSKIKSFFTK